MSRANPRAKSVNEAKRDADAAAILKRERQIVIADAYYKQRKSYRAIGEMLGVSATYVYQLLDEMKADGIARYERRASTLVEEELEFLQEREQMYLESFESHRAASVRTTDTGKPSPQADGTPGAIQTILSTRSREQKPLPTAPIDGLMKVSNTRIKLIEMIQKQELLNAEKDAANKGSALDQMTPQQSAIAFVQALASMAARADEQQSALAQAGRPGLVLEGHAIEAIHGIPLGQQTTQNTPNLDGHTFGTESE